jgi:hypothetical protein
VQRNLPQEPQGPFPVAFDQVLGAHSHQPLAGADRLQQTQPASTWCIHVLSLVCGRAAQACVPREGRWLHGGPGGPARCCTPEAASSLTGSEPPPESGRHLQAETRCVNTQFALQAGQDHHAFTATWNRNARAGNLQAAAPEQAWDEHCPGATFPQATLTQGGRYAAEISCL